jgi:peptidoglycan/xylan/chitin deacetylase (PgdA/CDA1 family)
MELIKKLAIRVLSQKLLVNPHNRFVFIYHDVSGPEAFQHSPLYSTLPDVFREQMDFLGKNFSLVSLEEVLSVDRSGNNRRLAALTFDDGFLSVKEIVFPLLSERKIPFTIFVNRLALEENRLLNDSEESKLEQPDNSKVFLDRADVKFLSRHGVLVGSHGATHRSLVDCDEVALGGEIKGNKSYLEELLDSPVRHLALPFGKREHYDERVLAASLRAGHEYVYSSNPTFFAPSSPTYQRRLIPRIGLRNETTAELTFLINRPRFKSIDI